MAAAPCSAICHSVANPSRETGEVVAKVGARLLCLPPRPSRFLTLWSRIIHHGQN
jgi:hypothetical protein